MRVCAIGDIHGRYGALKEVLERGKFDYENDKLIVLGDIVDGGYNTFEVVEELLKIKNLVFVVGNHDLFWMDHVATGWSGHVWLSQGGEATLESYKRHVGFKMEVPQSHKDFFNKGKFYHIEENMLFVHGGLGDSTAPQFCDKETLTWDRKMIYLAKERPIGTWDKIFVGHSTTQLFGGVTKPLKHHNVWLIDCGGGWDGKLCLMDVHTEEYWLSGKQKGGD